MLQRKPFFLPFEWGSSGGTKNIESCKDREAMEDKSSFAAFPFRPFFSLFFSFANWAKTAKVRVCDLSVCPRSLFLPRSASANPRIFVEVQRRRLEKDTAERRGGLSKPREEERNAPSALYRGNWLAHASLPSILNTPSVRTSVMCAHTVHLVRLVVVW